MNEVRIQPFSALSTPDLYAVLRLRSDVFVVEQSCAYPDLDGRDVEPDTLHLWTVDEHGPTAYLRVLADPDDVRRIGRVCTRADARGAGLAAVLIAAALERIGDHGSVLGAQAHLSGWYARFGYEVDGLDYVEDGIAHVPMRRAPRE